ncbi:uncharacterized protein LOC127788030 [Diospyros lotus]|uniref:uncharacterized protein LOC127788030 n=1 Tax=Diospyros lotus TaxID=55363 RepID=UPI0022510516|nr:uncharacterized protein LOC127788030 [Diospyros lotus]
MKTLLRLQELWDLVEYGFIDIEPNKEKEKSLKVTKEEEKNLKEIKNRDAKALFILQQAVHETIFSRIAAATTSKQAWSILQKGFHGDSKVIVVRLQSQRHDFETLVIKNGQSIAEFLSRAMAIVSQMRSYGEQILDETVVGKVLRSLTPKFDHVVDELMGSLQVHESRINRSLEKKEEKAFQVKEIATKHGDKDRSASRGRERGGSRDRGRGNCRGRGRNEGQRQSNEQGNMKSGIQCYHSKRYGHIKADCWYRDQNMNFAAENEEENKLFMACIDTNCKPSDLWFVDSSCSNHMTSTKSLFQELDETQRIKVQLGNKK